MCSYIFYFIQGWEDLPGLWEWFWTSSLVWRHWVNYFPWCWLLFQPFNASSDGLLVLFENRTWRKEEEMKVIPDPSFLSILLSSKSAAPETILDLLLVIKNTILHFLFQLGSKNVIVPLQNTFLFYDYNFHGWKVQEEHVHVLYDALPLTQITRH